MYCFIREPAQNGITCKTVMRSIAKIQRIIRPRQNRRRLRESYYPAVIRTGCVLHSIAHILFILFIYLFFFSYPFNDVHLNSTPQHDDCELIFSAFYRSFVRAAPRTFTRAIMLFLSCYRRQQPVRR